MSTPYAVRRKVVHEIFDDEAIVVDLETGSYYTLAGSAGAIWSLVVAGAPPEQIVGEVRARYQGEPSAIEAAVYAFLEELEREQLIMRDRESAASERQVREPSATPAGADRAAFEAPVLARYTDMEQILILDPIHDVDESGWPSAAPASARVEPAV
jgi:hypothetical protein